MPEINIDLGDVKDEDMGGRSYHAFDNGKYLFQIVESEIKETAAKRDGRANSGRYIKFVWDCMEPGKRGKVFENLNIENDNEQAVSIGRAQLKELAIATGHRDPNFIRSTEELHFKPCMLTLKKVKAFKGGDVDGMTNEVTGHDAADFGPAAERSTKPRGNEPPPHDDSDSIPF